MTSPTARLQNLLALTASSNDHEALAAARAANATLKKLGKTWCDVVLELNGPPKSETGAERAFLDCCRGWFRLATWDL